MFTRTNSKGGAKLDFSKLAQYLKGPSKQSSAPNWTRVYVFQAKRLAERARADALEAPPKALATNELEPEEEGRITFARALLT